jgi:hypothetical protein
MHAGEPYASDAPTAMETAERSIMRVVIAKAIWTHIDPRYQSFHGGKKKITVLLVINSVNNRKTG